MDDYTNNLLKKYKNDIKILNISNKNLKGILDLNKFKYLKELYCCNNKITEIINIPNTLKYLNCSNNKITLLLNLPDEMTGLNCKKNPIKELYYPFDIKPTKYPSNLTHLTFCDNFNQPIDNLPNSITHLTLGNKFNQQIDNLPNSITHLTLGNKFNQQIDNLPNSLKLLMVQINTLLYLLQMNSSDKNFINKFKYNINLSIKIDDSDDFFDMIEIKKDIIKDVKDKIDTENNFTLFSKDEQYYKFIILLLKINNIINLFDTTSNSLLNRIEKLSYYEHDEIYGCSDFGDKHFNFEINCIDKIIFFDIAVNDGLSYVMLDYMEEYLLYDFKIDLKIVFFEEYVCEYIEDKYNIEDIYNYFGDNYFNLVDEYENYTEKEHLKYYKKYINKISLHYLKD
jgi:hypothetical protein